MQRERAEYETPDLPDLADRSAWLRQQAAAFDAAAEPGSELGAKHGAIFRLVYGLLGAGEERR